MEILKTVEYPLVALTSISFVEHFETIIFNLGKERCTIRVVYMTDCIDGIVIGLQEGTVVGVSDGSFRDKLGSAC